MSQDFVTVMETGDSMHAELIKSVLEAAGIFCLITNESNPLTPMFGTRLRVAPGDEEAARSLIAENRTENE